MTAKDLVLALIRRIGTAGATGHVIEYTGEAIRALSMEGRMTVCNMSIEAGARAGHDRAGRHHVRLPAGPPARPDGRGWDRARRRVGAARAPTPGADYDRQVMIDAATLGPQVTWGPVPG